MPEREHKTVNSTQAQISQGINIFGNAITAIYTMYNRGAHIDDPAESLRTNLIDEDVPITGLITPESGESNVKMRDALVNELSGRLAVSVYDIIEGEEIAVESTGQFLRHIRNGVAHDNRFLGGNIDKKAEWRGYTITEEMSGDRVLSTLESPGLFMQESEWKEGFVEAGDVKELTLDILKEI